MLFYLWIYWHNFFPVCLVILNVTVTQMELSCNLIGGFPWQRASGKTRASVVTGTQKKGVHCIVPCGMDCCDWSECLLEYRRKNLSMYSESAPPKVDIAGSNLFEKIVLYFWRREVKPCFFVTVNIIVSQIFP